MPSTFDRRLAQDQIPPADAEPRPGYPGKRTLTGQLGGRDRRAPPAPTPVQLAAPTQRRAAARACDVDLFAGILPGPGIGMDGLLSADSPSNVGVACDRTAAPAHEIAVHGVAGGGGSLPHLAAIQASFGRHDLSDVRAHSGSAAATATARLGARAYATGRDIAFDSPSPDLHTAAHEAAHVVQQRGGVQLQDGLGRSGDMYERHADAVADAVVRGDVAEPLLDVLAGGRGSSPSSVGFIQRQASGPASTTASAAPTLGFAPTHDLGAPTRAEGVTIELAKSAILKLKSAMRHGSLSAEQAAVDAIVQLARVTPAVAMLVARHRELHPGGVRAVLRSIVPATVSGARDDDPNREQAIADLDAITADVLEIARALDDDERRTELARALDAATTTATGLGWTRPFDLYDARTRKYDHQPCPYGDDSPRTCDLADGERATKVTYIVDRLTEITNQFFQACHRRREAFQAAIDRDQRLVDFIAGLAIDIIVLAVSGPVAAGVGRAIRGAATATTDAAATAAVVAGEASAASKSAGMFASEVKKTLRRSVSKVAIAAGVATLDGDTRQRTIDVLGALEKQFYTQIRETKGLLGSLDDAQLASLQRQLEAYKTGDIDTEVDTFADHYLQQVAPVGFENRTSESLFDGCGRRRGMRAIGRAAFIAMPAGGVRMALVDELTERRPRLAKVERTAMVAADRLLGDEDDDLVSGMLHRSAQDAWIDTPNVELHFVRWIDDPRMQAMAAADAVTVPAARVAELPLSSLAATADERATP